jgi:DNA-binding LytR/AlgR family response regulator
MEIVIIEDEVKTARALAAMIQQISPGAIIKATLQSVKSAVAWFTTHEQPALIFMDIQLADGSCFDIFKETEIRAPVIFCTAYDEFALESFRANGVDYILKPFTQEKLAAAFHKVQQLKQFFSAPVAGKTSFLVYRNNKYTAIPIDNIAYFYIKLEMPAIHTFDGKEYFVQQSLDHISTLVPPGQFYRINRQYLVNFKAVKEVEHYYDRKLLVHLTAPTQDQIILNKNNTTAFMQWLDSH